MYYRLSSQNFKNKYPPGTTIYAPSYMKYVITTIDNIHKFYNDSTKDIYLHEIQTTVLHSHTYIYTTTEFISIAYYRLSSPTTYNIFNLELPTNILFAAKVGYLLPISDFTFDCLFLACQNNHVAILSAWLNSGIKITYDYRCIDAASENNSVDVLNWWLESKLEIMYSEYAIDMASQDGYIGVLQWWQRSGLELRYTHNAIDWSSRGGHISCLQWWLESGLELKYTKRSLNGVQNLGVLNWWKKSGLELKYDHEVMDYANVNQLQWWLDSKLRLDYTYRAIDMAFIYKNNNVLSWWFNSGLRLKYTIVDIDMILKLWYDEIGLVIVMLLEI